MQCHIYEGDIVITGCSLVTALGLDVVTSCAAARANISRSAAFNSYPVYSPDDGETDGVCVNTVPLLTEGFEGEARLHRLIQGALLDLREQCPDEPWRGGKSAFFLSVPPPDRLTSGSQLVDDEDTRKQMSEAVEGSFSDSSGCVERARCWLAKSAKLADWTENPFLDSVAISGHTGVAELIQSAADRLRRGALDVAIVGGVDSLIDENTLGWLEATNRLKSPDHPSGLQPGEAAGFLVLENARHAEYRGGTTLAGIETLATCLDDVRFLNGENSNGRTTSEVISKACASNRHSPALPYVIQDLNGEPYRAEEWGRCVSRLISQNSWFSRMISYSSSHGFGDTGAATGVVETCLAVRAFVRDYAPSKIAFIFSASDGQTRACFSLSSK